MNMELIEKVKKGNNGIIFRPKKSKRVITYNPNAYIGSSKDGKKRLYKDISLSEARRLIQNYIKKSDLFTLKNFWIPLGKKIRPKQRYMIAYRILRNIPSFRVLTGEDSLSNEDIIKIKELLVGSWRDLFARDCLTRYLEFEKNIERIKIYDEVRRKRIEIGIKKLFVEGILFE